MQILTDMRSFAWGHESESLADYIAWLVTQVERMCGVQLRITGDDLEARAQSLVEAMIRTGLAERLPNAG